MPSVGIFHANYWAGKATGYIGLPKGFLGRYPSWQMSNTIVSPSLFGALQVPWEWLVAQWTRAREAWRLYRRIQRLDRERAFVLLRALEALESPLYPLAQAAVADTAVTPKFNRAWAWAKFGHDIKHAHYWAENSWRHLKAMHTFALAADERHLHPSNPETNLLVELAYHGFSLRGHRWRAH